MEFLTDILLGYGYWGMLLAAFLAGSFFPFSSEAVMLALLAAGLEPWPLVVYGTIGNVVGSAVNYGVGRMGRLDWIERYLHISQQSMQRAEAFMAGRGALMGFFAFHHHPPWSHACQHPLVVPQHHRRQAPPLPPPYLQCRRAVLTTHPSRP